jgi:hypothetical protein
MIDDLHGAVILYPKFSDDYVMYATVDVIPCVCLFPSGSIEDE